MRRFVVFKDTDFYCYSSTRKLTLNMYDRENLVSLLDELGILHIHGDEQAILDGINDCNGDGDDYIMIGEIVNDKLINLVG